MTIRVNGIKEAIRDLKSVSPEIQKQFRKDVRVIVKPIIDTAKADYNQQDFPSGTSRKWTYRFPLEATEAGKNLVPSISTAKRNRSTILVIQKNAGAAVFEFANTGLLGEAFRKKNGNPARVIWPAVKSQLSRVQDEMKKLIEKVEHDINRRLI